MAPAPLGSWERYYETASVASGFQLVSCAPSHVCVVRLGPAHPILAEGRVVSKVTFTVSISQVSGKKKKGAAEVMADDVVGSVLCEDGEAFPIVAGVRGKVIELNEDPAAVTEGRNGYLLIILAHHKDVARLLRGGDKKRPRDEADAAAEAPPPPEASAPPPAAPS